MASENLVSCCRKQTGGMERLREDVTCSICLDVLEDPVSIECSHNFCRGCLATHWHGVSAQAPPCPECRRPCARDRMIPDTRLRALVEKITEPPQDAIEPQGPGAQQGPGAELEPGRPVQLVCLDEDGGLILDEEALSRCLEQGGVGGAPVCLVSVIGEQRRGKSFLLNCLLRRLRSPEAGDTAWMEPEDEALGGFESCTGKANVTKGVWIWGQPLWVQEQGRKVAVFLVDTEGCLDLQRDMETSIKLSVFSILLSSYWIFNISSTFTRLEADYLEMFLRVAKEVGGTCNLPSIQPLDLLVRDWQLSEPCGAAGGQEYLRDIARDLEATAEQPLLLEALQASGTRCYLLPHPGTRFTKSGAGTPHDMEPDFRQHLCDYVSSLARATWTHVRTDRAGKVLSGAQLAPRIKDVSRFLKTKRYDFSSPGKMAESLAQMREEKNSKAVETARREHQQFVQELDRGHQSTRSILSMEPGKMRRHLEGKRQELQGRCREQLRGQAPQSQAALQELEEELARQGARFLQAYEQRFQVTKENSKVIEDAKREYGQFVQGLDRGHQSTRSILRLKPAEMQRRLEGKRQELQGRCREELRGQAPQSQAALQELEEELARQGARFLQAYEQRFQVAEENSKVIEDAKREYGQFVQGLDRGHQSTRSILRLKPAEMQRRLEGKRQELQGRCREQLWGQAPQSQAALQELEEELARQGARFLQAYEQRFQVTKENSKVIEDAKREYGQFVQELDRGHQSTRSILSMEPGKMRRHLEEKRQELQGRCREELWGQAPQRQAALQELEEELAGQGARFLQAYEQRFQVAKENRREIEASWREYEQFVQEQDDSHKCLSSCLKVEPEEMQRRLEEKRRELRDRCRGELRGQAPQSQAALQELEEELAGQEAQFLQAYEQRYREKEAMRLGMVTGGAVVGIVGGVVSGGASIGLGVAAAFEAVEASVAVGFGVGSLSSFGMGAVGAGLWARFRKNQRGPNAPRQGTEEQDEAEDSERKPLLQADT
ncbi:uncharacterized protein LOC112544696 [Pelodiscus sinensis]|uniref:uncharacterized protein LOC112544696 n=1 Tax=Pelodiscus sinensis TaxID=13735 RepID=UPI003F6ACDF4